MKGRASAKTKVRFMALAMVLLMTLSVVPVSVDNDSDADIVIGHDYKYVMTMGMADYGANIITQMVVTDPNGTMTLIPGTQSYENYWAFGSDGIGPFNSFYATFTDEGQFYELLNPNNLSVKIAEWTIDGWNYDIGSWTSSSTASHITTCNTMWVLPTVYLKIDQTGGNTAEITFSNNPFTDSVAYAHTLTSSSGDKIYPYFAIGVYEGYIDSSDNKLKSISGVVPTSSTTKTKFRAAAVNTYNNYEGQTSMMWNYYQWSLYLFCSYTVAGTMDIKNSYGYPTTVMKTGQGNASGAFYETTGNNVGKIFLENPQGSLWELMEDTYFTGGNVYLGRNDGAFTDTQQDKTYMGSVQVTRAFIKTFDFTKGVLGFPLTYTATRNQSTTADHYTNSAASSAVSLMVGGGPVTDLSKVNINSILNIDGSGNGERGARLCYVFDTAKSGSYDGIDWSVDDDGVLLITSTNSRPTVIPDCVNCGPWGAHRLTITEIRLSSDITGIGTYAFCGLERVTSIKQYTSGTGGTLDANLIVREYKECSVCLKGNVFPDLYVPSNATVLGEGAFAGTILHYTPPTTDYEFTDEKMLIRASDSTVLYINPNLTGDLTCSASTVGAYAAYASKADSISLPNMVAAGAYAFSHSQLKSINSNTVGTADLSSLSVIKDCLLEECKGINTILVNGEGLTDIAGPMPFAGMSNLTTVGVSGVTSSGTMDLTRFTFSTTEKVVFDQNHFQRVDFTTKALLKVNFVCDYITEMHVKGDITITGASTVIFQAVKNLYFEDGVTTINSDAYMPTGNILETASMENLSGGTFRQFYMDCTMLTLLSASNLSAFSGYALQGCTNLVSLNSDDGKINVGAVSPSNYCFKNCKAITGVIGTCTDIGTNAFQDCSALISIDFANVTTVGGIAFYGCSSLETISLPAAKTIGSYAFNSCTKLQSVKLESAENIGSYAFASCTKLASVTLPAVKTINSYAFSSLASFTTYKVSDSDPEGYINLKNVLTIGGYAFSGATKVNNVMLNKDVKLTEAVTFNACKALNTMKVTDVYSGLDEGIVDISGVVGTNFGSGTFLACSAIKHAKIGNINPASTGGWGFFENCTILNVVEIANDWTGTFGNYTFNSAPLKYFGSSYDGTLGIIDLRGVRSISDSAITAPANFTKVIVSEKSFDSSVNMKLNRFNKMTSLELVGFSEISDYKIDSLFTGNNVFNSGVSYVSLTIDSIESGIVEGLGYLKSRITSLSITDLPGVKGIDSYAIKGEVFSGCTKLTEVRGTFGALGSKAFYGCSSLRTFGLPTDSEGTVNLSLIDAVPGSCFQGCISLYTIKGADLVSVGNNAFEGCTGLSAIIGSGIKLEKCTSIGDYAFSGVSGLRGELVLNVNIKPLSKYAFQGTAITKVSVVGDGELIKLSGILSEGVFTQCKSLRSVSLDGIGIVSDYAFSGCINLTLVILPDAENFYTDCFKGCDGITYLTTDAYDGEDNGMFISDGNTALSVEFGSVSFPNLIKVEGFTKVSSIEKNMFMDARKLETVSGFDSLTKLPEGTFSGCVSLTSVQIPNIVAIGNEAFKGCSSIKEISNENTSNVIMTYVTTLGDKVFEGCTELEKAYLSDSISSMGTYTFNGCDSLDRIQLPASLQTIPSYTFNGCGNLLRTSSGLLSIPAAVRLIDEHAFDGCSTIYQIVFPENLEKIKSYAFNGCMFAFRNSSNTFSVPSTVTEIGDHAFDKCTSLHYLDMSSSKVSSVGEYAFNECGLKWVKFSPVLLEIGCYAFYKCTSLESADLPSSLRYIGAYAFSNCKLTSVALPERVTDITNVFRNNRGLTHVSLPKSVTKGENAFVLDGNAKHSDRISVYVNSDSWVGGAPFTANEDLDIYSVQGSWNVRETWFNDSVTGEEKRSYNTITIPITEDELWYGGFNSPINAIEGSTIILPSVKTPKDTARYLFAYTEGGLKVGCSDDQIVVFGSMDLASVETAGPLTLHYTSSNPTVGVVSPTDADYNYGTTIVLEAAVPDAEGIFFAYWQCVLGDGITTVNYNQGDSFTIWRPVTEMRAVWNDVQFKLTLLYVKDGVLTEFPSEEVVGGNPQDVGFGQDIENLPTIKDPSEYGYDNYQFKGWYTGQNGTGVKYENGDPMPPRNLQLIAHFTPNPHYIDIYLSPAASEVSKTIVVYGETTITAIENNNNLLKYTDASHPMAATFIDASEYDSMKGMYISEWRLGTATGLLLNEGDKITSDINRIYAISDDIEYRLIYNFYDVGKEETLAQAVELNGVTLYDGDHTSLRYSDFTEDGGDRKYSLGQPKTNAKGFVDWKNPKSKTITFVSDANFVHNETSGTYVFEYTVKGSFDGSSFTVSYDKNYPGADNSNLVDSRSYKVGDTIILPTSTVMKRSGYIFEGWTWTVADDPDNRMPGGYNLEITDDLVRVHVDENMVFKFYAQWSAKSYAILYDKNGGSEISGRYGGDLRAYPDVQFKIASFSVKKSDGYRFIGWCIDPEGQGSKVYADGKQDAVVSSAEISEFVGESSDHITLYAIWKKVSYTIKFNLDGGTSTLPLTIEDVKVDDEFSLLPEGTYSYQYKNLQYWHIKDNTDEGSKYASTVKTVKLTRGMASMAEIVTEDKQDMNVITVKAIWANNRYTVTYNLTLDGKTSGSAKEYPVDKNAAGYAIDDEFYYPKGEYTLAGYDFKGWSPIAMGDTKAYEDGKFTATFASSTQTNKVTFYAVWEKKTYSIRWELDGGILTNSPFTYIDSVTHISNPVREGSVFIGWTAENLGTNAMMDAGDGTLTTRWTGTLVMATDFMNLQDAGNTVTMFANWQSKEYTLAYSINGGTCTAIKWNTLRSSVGSEAFDLAMVVDGVKPGYTLEGWSLKDGTYVGACTTDPKNPVKVKFTQTMVSASEDGETVWFYALWKPIKYYVRYFADDSMASYSTVKVSYDEPLALDEPVKAGWEFKGWRGALTGDTAQYSHNGIIWYSWDYGSEIAIGPYFIDLTTQAEGVVEMYGQWERTLYDVAYNFNGGTSGDVDGDVTGRVGQPFKFSSYGGSVKTGYTFAGWSVDKTTDISGNETFTETMAAYADINDMVTLYAVWTPITYEVEYRYDSSASYTKITAIYDVQFALESTDKTGYRFIGWESSDVDKTTAKYSIYGDYWIQWAESAETVKGPFFLNLTSKAGNTVHLDVVWELIEYKVVYNGNGGTGKVPTDESTYTIGAEFKLKPYDSLIGTNGNKNIVGWSTNPDARVAMSIDSFTEQLSKTADLTNTVTFYAVWVEGMYIVTVNVGDASVSKTPVGWTKTDSNTYTRGFEYGTSTNDVLKSWNSVSVTKEGYLFTGWSYDYSKVIDNMTITPLFDKVMQELLYYCIGIIVLIAIIAFVITRFERR